MLELSPLTFDEFLEATEPALFDYYCCIRKGQAIEEIFHSRLTEAYQYYLIIGGMPECVASWMKYKDPAKVSQIQQELIGKAAGPGILRRPLSGSFLPEC